MQLYRVHNICIPRLSRLFEPSEWLPPMKLEQQARHLPGGSPVFHTVSVNVQLELSRPSARRCPPFSQAVLYPAAPNAIPGINLYLPYCRAGPYRSEAPNNSKIENRFSLEIDDAQREPYNYKLEEFVTRAVAILCVRSHTTRPRGASRPSGCNLERTFRARSGLKVLGTECHRG